MNCAFGAVCREKWHVGRKQSLRRRMIPRRGPGLLRESNVHEKSQAHFVADKNVRDPAAPFGAVDSRDG